jgi:hypothetical protein
LEERPGVNRFLMRCFQNRSGGILAELRINRSQHRMLAHDDFIGGERNQPAAGHGIVWDKHCHVSFAAANRARNLSGSQDQATWVWSTKSSWISGSVKCDTEQIKELFDRCLREQQFEEKHNCVDKTRTIAV